MAVRFRFTRDFDYRVPKTRTDIAYKAGKELLVPEAHALAAEQAGAGARIEAKPIKAEKRNARSR